MQTKVFFSVIMYSEIFCLGEKKTNRKTSLHNPELN